MNLETQSFLDEREAARFLSERGYKMAPATLATKRSRGGGPRFRRFGPRIIYEPSELLEWAGSLLSEPAASTSEHEARAALPAEGAPA
jgi:hypothetical protein